MPELSSRRRQMPLNVTISNPLPMSSARDSHKDGGGRDWNFLTTLRSLKKWRRKNRDPNSGGSEVLLVQDDGRSSSEKSSSSASSTNTLVDLNELEIEDSVSVRVKAVIGRQALRPPGRVMAILHKYCYSESMFPLLTNEMTVIMER